jgi:V8-like Glu-specific endopeptidase
MIVQHPQGGAMKLALSTSGVQSMNANRTRIRYSVMTEPGSSGSPYLDLMGNLAEMHHNGDPRRRFK